MSCSVEVAKWLDPDHGAKSRQRKNRLDDLNSPSGNDLIPLFEN